MSGMLCDRTDLLCFVNASFPISSFDDIKNENSGLAKSREEKTSGKDQTAYVTSSMWYVKYKSNYLVAIFIYVDAQSPP